MARACVRVIMHSSTLVHYCNMCTHARTMLHTLCFCQLIGTIFSQNIWRWDRNTQYRRLHMQGKFSWFQFEQQIYLFCFLADRETQRVVSNRYVLIDTIHMSPFYVLCRPYQSDVEQIDSYNGTAAVHQRFHLLFTSQKEYILFTIFVNNYVPIRLFTKMRSSVNDR